MKHIQSYAGHNTSLFDVYLKLFYQNDLFPKVYTILSEYKTHLIKSLVYAEFQKYVPIIEVFV